MYRLTYYLWNEIVDEIVETYAPLFEAMHQVAMNISISRELVDELKVVGVKEIDYDGWHFLLKIELYADEIDGFNISLLAAEDPEFFEHIKLEAAAKYGVSAEELAIFEAEHGLDLDEGIVKSVEDRFGIKAEAEDNCMLFELVFFDSEDIDDIS